MRRRASPRRRGPNDFRAYLVSSASRALAIDQLRLRGLKVA
jgi:hypothetical protein